MIITDDIMCGDLRIRRQTWQYIISLHQAHPVDRLAGVDNSNSAVLLYQQVEGLATVIMGRPNIMVHNDH